MSDPIIADDPQHRHPCKVLLAEDDDSNAMLADAALRHFHCEVHVVGDGRSAVEAAATEPFDIVFMDYHMPRLDGLLATREIRANEEAADGRHIPIVAITASAMPRERDQCLAAGMNDVLVKPFVLAELERMLDRWVPSRRER